MQILTELISTLSNDEFQTMAMRNGEFRIEYMREILQKTPQSQIKIRKKYI